MKRMLVITILFLFIGAGHANAQLFIMTGKLMNGDRTAPFSITTTDQLDVAGGYRKFVTDTQTLGGGSAHIDLTFTDATQSVLTNIDIYDNGSVHLISCQNFSVISTNKKGSLTNSVKIVASCQYNPSGVDVSNGTAYLALTGTTYLKQLTDTGPYKVIISGTAGGGFNEIGDNFVFKGTLGSVLKPVP